MNLRCFSFNKNSRNFVCDYNITILRGDVPNFIAVLPMGGLSCPKICIAFLMDMDSP